MTTTEVRTEEAKGKAVIERAQQGAQRFGQSMESVRAQLQTYGNQIQEYLKNIEADVEGYRFSVEKKDDGLTIDLGFKATLRPKHGRMGPEITP